jgi:hypothetical protein
MWLMRTRLIIFLLLPVVLCAASNGNGNGNGNVRGHKTGDYTLTVAGHFIGKGAATVTTTVSLNTTVKLSDGTAGTLVASDMVITNSTFKGAGTVMGVACTVQGRLDLPSATDGEQTARQAITARITGTFKDAKGNVGRFVAVQNDPSPAPDGNGAGSGSGSGGGGSGGNGGGSGDNSGASGDGSDHAGRAGPG